MFPIKQPQLRKALIAATIGLSFATTPLFAEEATEAAAKDAEPTPEQMDGNAAVISVNGEPVTRNMFTIFYQRTVPQQAQKEELDDKMRTALLDQLVNYLILADEAEKLELDKQPEVQAGLTLVRAQYLANLTLSRESVANPITEEQLQTLYQEATAGPAEKEYKARHILLKEEDQAKEIITQLNEGADFQELAKEHSTGPSGPSGGDLGWFGAGRMVPEFEKEVMALEPGNYSSTPVKTQFGWHIVLLEETRDKAKPSFEKMKDKLLQQEQRERLSNYLKKLRAEADIQVLAE
jgi:peptidyl-prolyl cis-trans isomerase C